MNPLADILAAEVSKTGILPFVRFMELALYCPDLGFYERKKDTVGKSGDFYTSVSVGPLFGQLLAFQFDEWRAEWPVAGCRLRMVEAGAHDGKLARDVLTWLRAQRPAVFKELEYCLVEPSAQRRQWQARTLVEFGPQVRWLTKLSDLGNPQSAIGDRQFTIVFSNELLDAFPVHRLGWDAAGKEWFEWGVAVENGKFIWARMPPAKIPNSEFRIPNLPQDLLAVLPDGFTTEMCPAAESWWRAAAGVIQRGKLLTLDYGLAAEEFFQPGRHHGTLRTYQRHQVGGDVLENVGAQDITAHVNFTALQSAGEAAGLQTEALVTQSKFLTGIAGKIWQAPKSFGEWTAAHTRQFQTLTHPEHLGRPFRALVQARAV